MKGKNDKDHIWGKAMLSPRFSLESIHWQPLLDAPFPHEPWCKVLGRSPDFQRFVLQAMHEDFIDPWGLCFKGRVKICGQWANGTILMHSFSVWTIHNQDILWKSTQKMTCLTQSQREPIPPMPPSWGRFCFRLASHWGRLLVFFIWRISSKTCFFVCYGIYGLIPFPWSKWDKQAPDNIGQARSLGSHDLGGSQLISRTGELQVYPTAQEKRSGRVNMGPGYYELLILWTSHFGAKMCEVSNLW
jgi:hypothetical protein